MFDHDTNGEAIIEMDLLPPRWLDIKDEINTHLEDIAAKMKKLDQLHAKHVLPGFDDEAVKAREEREIEHLTSDVTRGFVACQNRIRKIDVLVREQQNHPSRPLSSADEKMAQNLKISLATRVGDVSSSFRKKQSAYLKKLRSLGGMTTPIDRVGSPQVQNPYTDPAMLESETDRSSAQSTLLQTAQVRRRTAGVMDTAIEQREREIEKIAQGVIDLSNIFQELNGMVIDQGSLLDRIDYNVERTTEHVKEADKELTVATGYQKRSTKRKIILLLVLVVAGLFILLLIKPKRRTVDTPAAAPLEPMIPGQEGQEGTPPRMADSLVKPMVSIAEDEANTSSRRILEWKQRRRRNARNLMVM
nr:t-snare affecting a late golgi compartment protein 2 [Quercus suber]